MKTVTIYLTSGQTITYEGTYTRDNVLGHRFGVDASTGLSLDFIDRDMIAAVTAQENGS